MPVYNVHVLFVLDRGWNIYFKHILLSNKYRQWIRHKL